MSAIQNFHFLDFSPLKNSENDLDLLKNVGFWKVSIKRGFTVFSVQMYNVPYQWNLRDHFKTDGQIRYPEYQKT